VSARTPRGRSRVLFEQATRRFRAEGLALDLEAERMLRRIYSRAADILESPDVERERAGAIRLANANQVRLLNALVQTARERQSPKVDENIVANVLNGICPLFPFC
jgi:hypothetical protein